VETGQVQLQAIKTNTSILVSLDGKDVELTAADLVKMRENEVVAPELPVTHLFN